MARIVEKRRAIYMYGLFSIINEDVPEYEIVAVSNCVDYLKRYADELNNFIGYKLFTVLEVTEIIDDNFYYAVGKLNKENKYEANIVTPSIIVSKNENKVYQGAVNKSVYVKAHNIDEAIEKVKIILNSEV